MPAERFDEELPADLKAIENALREFSPSLGQLNRERLMYLAGQASATNSSLSAPRQIAWPLATAALALISLTLGGFLIFTGRGAERIVYVDRPVASPAPSTVVSGIGTDPVPPAVGDSGYFELRDSLLTNGLDALASPPPQRTDMESDKPPQTWPDFRDQLLNDALKG
jgi:hypothetical protein